MNHEISYGDLSENEHGAYQYLAIFSHIVKNFVAKLLFDHYNCSVFVVDIKRTTSLPGGV